MCYPIGYKISGPFISAAEWSEGNHHFLYYYYLLFYGPTESPGRAAEKSMPDGSVGDMANGPLLFSISPRLRQGTRDYHIQSLMRTFVWCSQCTSCWVKFVLCVFSRKITSKSMQGKHCSYFSYYTHCCCGGRGGINFLNQTAWIEQNQSVKEASPLDFKGSTWRTILMLLQKKKNGLTYLSLSMICRIR